MVQHLVAGAARRGWAANAVESLLAWAGRIGADPTDSTDTALQKRLDGGAFGRAAADDGSLWSVIYLVAGVPLSAAIPAFYTAAAPVNTLLFSRTRSLRLLSLYPAADVPGPAVASDDEPGRLPGVERGGHLGCAVSACPRS